MHELVINLTGDALAIRRLGENGDNSGTTVATDDSHNSVIGGSTSDPGQEACSTDNVKGSDTEDAAGVEDTSLFEGLGNDGDGGVDGVGDNKDVSIRSNTGDSRSKVADNGGIGLFSMSIKRQFRQKQKLTLKRSSRVIYFNVSTTTSSGYLLETYTRLKPGRKGE